MPVNIVCECGNKLTVSEKLIGKRVRCPACKRVLSVPDDASDDVTEESTAHESQVSGKIKYASAPNKQGDSNGKKPGGTTKSRTLLFVVLGAGALLSCFCLGAIAFGILYLMVPQDKVLTGPFPIEEKGRWSSSDRKTKIPNPLFNLQVGYVGYKVPLKANIAYEILLNRNGGDSDPYLLVENLEGLIDASDDDGGGFPNAKVVYTPNKDGDYGIRAATLKGSGEFTLIIRELKSGQNPGPDDKGKTPGDKDGKLILEETGPWTKQDPVHPATRSPFKTYKVALKAGKVYTIDLVKKEKGQDPYLFLTDKAGKILAKDDDSGGFPNARIIFTPSQEGEYQILATSINQSLGAFTLTVREKLK